MFWQAVVSVNFTQFFSSLSLSGSLFYPLLSVTFLSTPKDFARPHSGKRFGRSSRLNPQHFRLLMIAPLENRMYFFPCLTASEHSSADLRSEFETKICITKKHRATSRKFAGSTPNGVIKIFHWRNPSGRTMALGSTQPLTEMRTRKIYCVDKGASKFGWQNYHLHVLIF